MRRHEFVAVACLVAVLAVSGCVGLFGGGGGDVDPATVGERVDQRLDSVETLRATVVQRIESRNSSAMRLRVTYDRPDRLRVVFENGSLAGTRIVSNGSVTWRYDPDEEVLRVTEGPYFKHIRDVFPGTASIGPNATFEGNETLAGEDAVELSYAVDESAVSLLLAGGEETSQFNGSGASQARFRVWLDTDRWLPRKTRIELPMFRENRTTTLYYRNVTVNPDLPAGHFQFDPPADVRRVAGDTSAFRPPENATSLESRSAALDPSPVPVPDPSVPDRFAFGTARVFEKPAENLTGVELTYEDGRDRIEVVVFRDRPRLFDAGETVQVDGREALLVKHPEAVLVEWECAETLRLVAGPADADRETLLSVAQSVGCGS